MNKCRLKNKKHTDIYVSINHLVYLDIIPLLSSLHCLQVVKGRVIVDQLPSPFTYFLLQIERDKIYVARVCGYRNHLCVSLLVCSQVCLFRSLPLDLP